MKRKGEDTSNWLRDELDRVKKQMGTYIKSRWYVVEITPAQRFSRGDGHGGSEWDWTTQKEEKVSPVFYSKVNAETFLNEHEPDEGKSLTIREEKLYRKVVETWY